jgi:DnaJ-domain-containing protein 1
VSETDDSIKRLAHAFEQLLELERARATEREVQTKAMEESMKQFPRMDLKSLTAELDKKSEHIDGLLNKGGAAKDDITEKMADMRQVAEERHQEELAYRNRLVRMLEEQTSLLRDIAEHLKRK